MAAAGAALLRSANKMAPRLASVLERRGRLPTSSRFSTSSGSTPAPPDLRGSQTDNKKVISASQWDRVKTAAIEATTTCVFFTVVICVWVNPALDRINAKLEASNRLDKEILDEVKRGHQRIREQLGLGSSKS